MNVIPLSGDAVKFSTTLFHAKYLEMQSAEALHWKPIVPNWQKEDNKNLAMIVKAQNFWQVCMIMPVISMQPLFEQLQSVAAVSTGGSLTRR